MAQSKRSQPTPNPLTLADRLTALEQQVQQHASLRQRAVDAANTAAVTVLKLEAQIALLKELIAEASA